MGFFTISSFLFFGILEVSDNFGGFIIVNFFSDDCELASLLWFRYSCKFSENFGNSFPCTPRGLLPKVFEKCCMSCILSFSLRGVAGSPLVQWMFFSRCLSLSN